MTKKSEKQLSALKYDGEKPPMDLLPTEALREVAKVLAHGANKYTPHNWREGFKWSRLYAACLRHLFSWAERKDYDEESGLLHLAHANCCLMFLLTHQVLGLGEDDRWSAS